MLRHFHVNSVIRYCTMLLAAAQNGHLRAVKVLLRRKHVDVNAKDALDDTALHLALKGGHVLVARTILSAAENLKLDINAKGMFDFTPLALAIEQGLPDLAKTILEFEHVDTNESSLYGQSPLIMSIKGGHTELVTLLLQYPTTDPNFIAPKRNVDDHMVYDHVVISHEVAKLGNVDMLRRFLQRHDFDPIVRNPTSGCTILHVAVGGGHTECIELLLADGRIEKHAKDNDGRNALFWARKTEHLKLLLAHGVNPNEQDIKGATVLHFATSESRANVVNALVEASQKKKTMEHQDASAQSPDLNATDNEGRDVLFFASDEETLSVLLACETFKCNVRDIRGDTSLHNAIRVRSPKVVEALLRSGRFDLTATNNAGETPCQLALSLRTSYHGEETYGLLSKFTEGVGGDA